MKPRREPGNEPVTVKALACGLPPQAWSAVNWREGANNQLSGRFTALRVHPAIGIILAARCALRSSC